MASSAQAARVTDRRCATATLLAAVTTGLSAVREPKLVRERFEQELRLLIRARSVTFREDGDPVANRPNVLSFDVPCGFLEGHPRLEAVFEPTHPADDRARQMLAAAALVTGLLLEIERTNGRWPLACARSRPDGAAPLIGSSQPIRAVRDRIEKVAATDFTVLIEGPSRR